MLITDMNSKFDRIVWIHLYKGGKKTFSKCKKDNKEKKIEKRKKDKKEDNNKRKARH